MDEIDEELDYTPDIITLEDEDGKEFNFEVIDAADYDEDHYLAVVPCVDDEANLEEESDLIIMRVCEDENGDEYLDVVDDDEELAEVSGVFADRLSELFDIETGE